MNAPYLAGLFDGEGSIMIKKQARPTRTYFSITTHLALVEGIGGNLIKELHHRWGGHYSVRTYNRPNCRPLHRWHLEDRKAAAFITFIQPHLRLKAAQAMLALELVSLKGREHRLSDTTYDRMTAISLEMADLNRRGV